MFTRLFKIGPSPENKEVQNYLTRTNQKVLKRSRSNGY